MGGYIGTKAVNLSTTGADINGNANVDGTLDVTGAFTSLGIDDNATSTAITIDASENVGIGTAAPAASSLTLDHPTFSQTVLRSGGVDRISLYGDAGISAVDAKANALALYAGGAERMRIDASGNVGIGTASTIASADFTVNSAVSARINLASDGVERFGVFADSGIAALYAGGTNVMTLSTNATERLRIDSSGNVLVAGTSLHGVELMSLTFNGSVKHGIGLKTTGPTGSAFQVFYNSAGTGIGSIVQASASTTAYNTSSDYRLKENITPIQGAGDIVKSMRPCTYTFTTDGVWSDGFIAHELQELHPLAVSGSKDAMKDEEYEVTPAVYEDIIIPAVDAVVDEDGNVTQEAQPERTEQQLVSEAVMGTRSVPDYQGVDYSKLTPILTAALQEALNKIDALETRLTALEATP